MMEDMVLTAAINAINRFSHRRDSIKEWEENLIRQVMRTPRAHELKRYDHWFGIVCWDDYGSAVYERYGLSGYQQYLDDQMARR